MAKGALVLTGASLGVYAIASAFRGLEEPRARLDAAKQFREMMRTSTAELRLLMGRMEEACRAIRASTFRLQQFVTATSAIQGECPSADFDPTREQHAEALAKLAGTGRSSRRILDCLVIFDHGGPNPVLTKELESACIALPGIANEER